MKQLVGSDHRKQLNRLKRIEGQIKGITQMIERQDYCISILSQMKAVRGALSALENKILESHLEQCVTESFKEDQPDHAKEKMKEIIEILKKAAR